MFRHIKSNGHSAAAPKAPAAALLVFALIFTLCTSAFAGKEPNNAPTPDDLEVVGSNISAMSAVDIYGAAVTGEVFSQKSLTVLHYFATWSAECVRELPMLQQALNHYGAGEIAVYGLLHEDATSNPESCAMLFEELSISYGCLRLDGVLTALVNVYPYVPQTFFINSEGVVVRHFPGSFESYAQLDSLISQELGHPSVFHEVRFIDGLTGALIQSVFVSHGESAVPPEPPQHEGYMFSAWEGSYQNVTEDRVVRAVYVSLGTGGIPGDVDGDGSLTTADALMILRHVIGTAWSEGVALNGDVNGSGSVTVADAMLVLRHALGLITL